MTIGEAVRLIRTFSGETLRGMASVLDISHVHLCNVENGKVTPSLQLLARIRHGYGYCPLALVALSDDTLDLARHRALLRKDGKL